MTHWSQTARDSANATFSSEPVDAAVRECIHSDWEPLAEIDELPDWELTAEIGHDPESSGLQGESAESTAAPQP